MSITSKLTTIAAAAGGGENFFSLRIGGAGNDQIGGVATDSNKNIIVAGYGIRADTGENAGIVVKISPAGEVLWQITEGGTSYSDVFFGVAIDSADNIYACGNNYSVSSGDVSAWVVKYDSSGTKQWTRNFSNGYSVATYFSSAKVDSDDNIYLVGVERRSGGSENLFTVKYDSSGTLLASKKHVGSSPADGVGSLADIAIGATQYYAIGDARTLNSGSVVDRTLFMRGLKSTLNETSSKAYGVANYISRGTGIAVDSSENVFGIFNYTHNSPFLTTTAVVKLTTTLAQSKIVLFDFFSATNGKVRVDSQGNVLIASLSGFMVLNNNLDTPAIVQRSLSNRDITFDSDDNIIAAGITTSATSGDQGGLDWLILRLPADYSLTGSYEEFTYTDVTPETPVSSSVVSAIIPVASSAPNATESSTSLTTLDGSFGSTLDIIG